ncbi:MAG: hypothetical protein ACI364_02450 [Coriobacteriales bacterium]
MAASELPSQGFGFSWVLPFGKDLLTKSVAPSFVFVDYATFSNTNVSHRLAKRMIDAYVSVNAPLWLLASVYGWDDARDRLASDDDARGQACAYVERALEDAAAGGADALVLCDDLVGANGPVPDPLFIVEHVLPLYERFAAKAHELSLPIIYHAEGDIREYYPYLAQEGFDAVHVAHPGYEQTEELVTAVRDAGMTPLGGLIGARVAKDGAGKLADFARRLVEDGPLLVCDDGAVSDADELSVVIEALAMVRDGISPSD